MPRQPAYFESQASAAAALEIDIEELRDAKREGCPAFRSGRVYLDQLLSWLQEKRSAAIRSIGSNGARSENAKAVITQTIRGISDCADLGVLTPEQYFDFCHTIVEQANDPDLREVFRRTLNDWVIFNFSEIAESKARKAHPRIMSWLRSENKAWACREYGLGDIETGNPD